MSTSIKQQSLGTGRLALVLTLTLVLLQGPGPASAQDEPDDGPPDSARPGFPGRPKRPSRPFDSNLAKKRSNPGLSGATNRRKSAEEEEVPALSEIAGGSKKCKPMRPNMKITFDFKGDIKELVSTISKTTCKNFILTNKVRSQKFEIVSPTPITVQEAWRAFLSALEANDFTLVRTGRYYKIIQANDGTRSPLPIYEAGSRHPVYDRMVTKIWKPKHATDLAAIVNYLNIFKSNRGQIHPFASTNTIIATDYGSSIAKLERILNEIDQPGALEQVHVVPVQHAAAADIAKKLTEIFEPNRAGRGRGASASSRIKVNKGKQAKDEDGGVTVSKIISDDRTNKLIIIASQRSFRQIMSLMRELDVPEGDGGDGQIHVVRLKHANAEELASTLASLASGRSTRPTTVRSSRSTSSGRKTTPGGTAALFSGEVKVTADKATNSLVITASKGDFASVKKVIEKLDIARLQVFVEAVIMEVSTTRDRNMGTGWHGGIAPTIGGETTPIIFGNTPAADLSSLQGSLNPVSFATLLGFAGAIRGPELAGTEDIIPGGIPAVGVILNALQTSNNVNVVSTPHLLTLDNEEAEIQVNERRPFPSGLTLGGLSNLGGLASGAAGNSLGNIGGLGLGSVNFTREDVGLTLKLKPQINDDEYVRLEIDQELSDVAGTDPATQQTITSKRSAKTVVVMRSQDSVVIGGLVRDKESISESKTPILGDIPLLGWLFKQQIKVVEKVNLILILTPYIIRGPDDFQAIFERKMEERKDFVDRFYGKSDEFRASIDWDRKRGPLASYRLSMRREMAKAENDGPGKEEEVIIKASEQESGLREPDLGDSPGQGSTGDPGSTGKETPGIPE